MNFVLIGIGSIFLIAFIKFFRGLGRCYTLQGTYCSFVYTPALVGKLMKYPNKSITKQSMLSLNHEHNR